MNQYENNSTMESSINAVKPSLIDASLEIRRFYSPQNNLNKITIFDDTKKCSKILDYKVEKS